MPLLDEHNVQINSIIFRELFL